MLWCRLCRDILSCYGAGYAGIFCHVMVQAMPDILSHYGASYAGIFFHVMVQTMQGYFVM